MSISRGNEIETNIDYEIQVLLAMQGYKPVGVSKYFQMACIIDKLQENVDKHVNSKAIWEHLDKLYDMQQLDENESIPFPNNESEFCLPDKDYMHLKQKKSEAVKLSRSSPDRQSHVMKSMSAAMSVRKNEAIKEAMRSATILAKDSRKEGMIEKSRSTPSRRDSFSQSNTREQSAKSMSNTRKETSTPVSSKREAEKKIAQLKGRSSTQTPTNGLRKDDDSKERFHKDSHSYKREEVSSTSKRTTRGSVKPEDFLQDSYKSQSPLTIAGSSTPTSGGSAPKRRRI